MKRRAEGEHFFDRFGRRDLYFVVGGIEHISIFRKLAEAHGHSGKGIVRLQEAARHRIDQRDAGRHVGQNLLVKNNFAFDPARRFGLAAIKSSSQSRSERGSGDQPTDKDGCLAEQVVHRFVSDGFRLSDHRYPTGGLKGGKRVKIPVALDMAVLFTLNLLQRAVALG